MKNNLRQFVVFFSILSTVMVQLFVISLEMTSATAEKLYAYLPVAPIQSYFIYSVWIIIDIGLSAYAIFQLLPRQRENPWLQKTGYWVVVSVFANSIYFLLGFAGQSWLALPFLLVQLFILLFVNQIMHSGPRKVSINELLTSYIPIRLYLDWLIFTSITSIIYLLSFQSTSGFGLAINIWFTYIRIALFLILFFITITGHDIIFNLIIIWTLLGIIITIAMTGIIPWFMIIIEGLVILFTVFQFILYRKKHNND